MDRPAPPAWPGRVIFVNRFYRPDISATSQMLTQLAEHLAGAGFDVEVIAGRAGYTAAAALPSEEVLGGVRVIRVGGRVAHRDGLARRAADSIAFALFLTGGVWRRARKGDVVVTLTDPPMIGTWVTLAARLRGARTVHWLQDVFPEVAVAVLSGPARAVGRLIRPVRDVALRAGSAVTIGERMQTHVEHLTGRPATLIPNWANDQTIVPLHEPVAGRQARGELPGCRLVVGYQGNLGRVHDAESIIEAATRLATRPDIRFVVTGGGVGIRALRNAVAERSLTNVEIRPYVDDAQLNASLCLPDVHLISLLPAVEGFVVPSKLYSALAAGRGVIFIGDADGEVARILDRARAGTVIPWGDGAGLARLVEDIAAHSDRVVTWGRRARAYLDAELTRARGFAAWRAYLGRVETPD